MKNKPDARQLFEENNSSLNTSNDFPPEKPMNGNNSNNDSDEKISIIEDYNFDQRMKKSSCCK